MINNTGVSNEQVVINTLNNIRLYWQTNFSSYEELMDELASRIDPTDPALSGTLQEQEVFLGLFSAMSLDDIDEAVGVGAGILGGAASEGVLASILTVGNAAPKIAPITNATNVYTALDSIIEIATPANTNIPAGVRSLAAKAAVGAGILGVIPGIVEYAASGFDPDVGAKNLTSYGAGILAAAGVAALLPVLLPSISAATLATIAALAGGVVAWAVSEAWDSITDALATGALTAAEAISDFADAIGDALEAAGQAAVDAINDAMDAAGEIFSGFAAGLQGLAGWMDDAWDAFMAAWNSGSPLVLDLDGDGIELVSLVNSDIYWDIDQDGFAEAIGWVQADDGFLAIDANSDGIITDHSELLGSVAEDGFTDLRLLDSNSDNVINASDPAFANLLVWRDLNQNGISEESELFTLAELDIVSINLNATAVNQTNQGHDISHVSTYTVDDGVSGPQNLAIVDVWFQYDDINSEFVGDYTLDLASLFTVNQRGYGTLPDLYIAASMDNDLNDPDSLLSLLTAFSGKTLDGLLVDDGSLLAEVEAIMLRWAGVDGVDPASRGHNVDARKLEFLEELFGQEFLQAGWLEDPGGFAGDMLDKSFDIALDALTARLIAQSAGQALFTGSAFYNPVTDTLNGVTGLNQDTLDTVLALAQDASKVSDKVAFWKGVVNVIDQLVGVSNLSSGDQTALNTAISTSDSTLSTALILESLEWLSEVGGSYTGTSGNDTFSGTVGDDWFAGGGGADTFTGGIGADFINGQAGDDILNGQSGDDELLGDSGSDTYLYFAGQGHDTFRENGSGADRILFGPGIAFTDLTFTRISNTALLIEVSHEAGGGAITIESQFRSSDAGYIETLEFADSSTVSLNSLVYTLHGTSAGETLNGIRYGGSQNDTIYGYGGDDTIYGYHSTLDTGNNSLYGGDGNDNIYGAHGVDWIEGGAGNDYLKGWNGNDTLDGGDGDDELHGESQDDLLIGGAGADKLSGGNNNDILIGGLGADELTGNTGSDIFRFLTGQTFDAVDTIKDFNPSYDAIDLRDVLYEYDPLTEIIADFVQITTSGSNSLLAVDADGGADNFIQIAVIQGQTGMTDEAALVASGKLLVA
jgi:hypothetical protein